MRRKILSILILGLLIPIVGSTILLLGLTKDNIPGEAVVYQRGEAQVAPIESVFDYFDIQVQDRLRAIPIMKHWSVSTALAQTTRWVDDIEDVAIYVSVEWDTDEFPERFKVTLLTHEYLHILEAEGDIDIERFYEDVQEWYNDPTYGEPTSTGNYIKYMLSHWLYSEKEYYADRPVGIEEFAYIGQGLVAMATTYIHSYPVPENIYSYYEGILADEIIK